MHSLPRLWRLALVGSVAAVAVLSLSGVSSAGAGGVHGASARQQASEQLHQEPGGQPTATHTGDDSDLADQQAQYDFERTAPAATVSGQALVDAAQQAASLHKTGGSWQEFTNEPYNAQPSNYTDPLLVQRRRRLLARRRPRDGTDDDARRHLVRRRS